MLKAKDIMGLPVIEVTAGKQLGNVKDFLLDSKDWSLQGILLETKHWFSSPRYVECQDVISFGEDAITIKDEQCVKGFESSVEMNCLLNGNRKIKGLPVITVNGNQLGLVEDVYFGEELGKKIIGYELTDGFISDLTEGRFWLPAPEHITFGEDAIIVPLHSDQDLGEIDTLIKE